MLLRSALTIRVSALLAAAGFLVLALGIRAATGDWPGSRPLAQYSGTALYASMVYAGVVVLWPRIRAAWAGVIALGFCWSVEAAQLSGLPAELSARNLVARAALGVHFDWTDVLWYPAGIVPLVAVDWLLRERQPRSGGHPSPTTTGSGSLPIASRPAVRIICLDAGGRVLLLCWQDPFDGAILWEPPGGGIEPGESPYDTARRELTEETGLDPSEIVDRPIVVERDVVWNGRRFIGPEQFFVARYATDRPQPSRLGLLPDEQQNLRGHAWVDPAEFASLDGRLEPPTLAQIVRQVDQPSA